MLLVHLFVCFVRVSCCHFPLPLGVGVWLWFVIVALLDFSINFFVLLEASVIEIKVTSMTREDLLDTCISS